MPTIPKSAIEFCDKFREYLIATVIFEERIAVIFFSGKIYEILGDITDIQFEGTFDVVPKLFYQLFTIFIQLEDIVYQSYIVY